MSELRKTDRCNHCGAISNVAYEYPNTRGGRIIKRVDTAREVFHEFCDASTIHGLKYLKTSSIHEKVVWIIVFLISISFCSVQIHNIWQRWNQDPVIVSFNENLVPIIQIPFPAITICQQVKTQRNLFDYSAVLEEVLTNGLEDSVISDYDLQQFQLVASMCLKDRTTFEISPLLDLFNNFSQSITEDFMVDLAPPMDDTMKLCVGVLASGRWKCKRGLGTLLTEDGVCYTMNLRNSSELLTDGT